jgi:hypothetical protein
MMRDARLRANGFQWLTFAPVSTKAAEYFQVNESAINWLSTAFLFSFVVISPYVVYYSVILVPTDDRTGVRYGHSIAVRSTASSSLASFCWPAIGFAMQVLRLTMVSLGSSCLARF